ncbi:MAG TPA: 2,3-bisphosphoglycerate-independent phosphoglycerate mutase [Gemmatimonadetes bacterium]|nr:2,3-bisphosphoglycerate-independent phosphoglycerate mutase [Gemmatimonadota bacterium]
MRKVLLIILDGWGHSDFKESPAAGNAIELARVPHFRRLYDRCPRSRLACSGIDVGLPADQMGNSEVGHLNLGGGRIVYQDIARVDQAIADGVLADRLGLDTLIEGLRQNAGTLHIAGLLSDGGVHSHIRHFTAVLDLLPTDVPVRLHCFTDGRDTSPKAGTEYVSEIGRLCAKSTNWAVASVIGRYWAMDRDKRWDRTRRAYELIVNGQAENWMDSPNFLEESYARGVTDEFIEPTGIRGVGEAGISEADALLLMNFRADRMRQLTSAMILPDFDAFARQGGIPSRVVTMAEYEPNFPVSVAFPLEHVEPCLSQLMSRDGRQQLKTAETEKYAHVTYFFNGGEEAPFDGEDRILVPSPKVATYDLQPEMSARLVANVVAEALHEGKHDFILVNFANADMVGHTGSIRAAIEAVEVVDSCLGKLIDVVADQPEWVALVTADHGNAEKMLNDEGDIHTAHTMEPVDFIVFDPRYDNYELKVFGRLADVAPTVLHFMGISLPDQMTGSNLVTSSQGAGWDVDP